MLSQKLWATSLSVYAARTLPYIVYYSEDQRYIVLAPVSAEYHCCVACRGLEITEFSPLHLLLLGVSCSKLAQNHPAAMLLNCKGQIQPNNLLYLGQKDALQVSSGYKILCFIALACHFTFDLFSDRFDQYFIFCYIYWNLSANGTSG